MKRSWRHATERPLHPFPARLAGGRGRDARLGAGAGGRRAEGGHGHQIRRLAGDVGVVDGGVGALARRQAGVADEDIGFTETAPAFVNMMNRVVPAIYYMRVLQGARYASVLKLFDLWNSRIAAKALVLIA